MKRIALMRHGEGDHNVERFFSGNPNHPNYRVAHLTNEGRQQVKDSAKKMSSEIKKMNLKEMMIFVSPLPRTRQTAEILQENIFDCCPGLKIEEKVVDSLIEVDMGDFEGKNIEEFSYHPWNLDHYQKYGGEGVEDLLKRGRKFVDEINQLKNLPDFFVAVSHGSPLRYLAQVLGVKEDIKLDTAGFYLTNFDISSK